MYENINYLPSFISKLLYVWGVIFSKGKHLILAPRRQYVDIQLMGNKTYRFPAWYLDGAIILPYHLLEYHDHKFVNSLYKEINVINNLASFICIIEFHGIIFWQSMIPHFTKITQLSLPSLNLNVIFYVVIKNQRDIQNDCCRCPFVHKDYVLITCIISQELVSSKKKLHYLDVWLLYKSFPYLQLCVIVHDLKLYPLKMWVFSPTV